MRMPTPGRVLAASPLRARPPLPNRALHFVPRAQGGASAVAPAPLRGPRFAEGETRSGKTRFAEESHVRGRHVSPRWRHVRRGGDTFRRGETGIARVGEGILAAARGGDERRARRLPGAATGRGRVDSILRRTKAPPKRAPLLSVERAPPRGRESGCLEPPEGATARKVDCSTTGRLEAKPPRRSTVWRLTVWCLPVGG